MPTPTRAPTPPPPSYSTHIDDPPIVPDVPTIAVLRGRADAKLEALIEQLARGIRGAGGRPALLWSERSETLEPGVVSVAETEVVFPDALRGAASTARCCRFAHLGAGAERQAVERLFERLGDVTHAIVDGRLIAAMRPTLSVLVSGDGFGEHPPFVAAVADRCDTEVFAPSEAIASALLLALDRRGGAAPSR